MNAAEQAMFAIRLQQALDVAGIVVTHAVRTGGNVSGWEPVPAATILGYLVRNGWKIEDLAHSQNENVTAERGTVRMLKLERR